MKTKNLNEVMKSITNRSMFLQEKIDLYKSGKYINCESNSQPTNAILNYWRDIYKNMPKQSFEKRLSWSSINIDDVQTILEIEPIDSLVNEWSPIIKGLISKISYKEREEKDYIVEVISLITDDVINEVLDNSKAYYKNIKNDLQVDLLFNLNNLINKELETKLNNIIIDNAEVSNILVPVFEEYPVLARLLGELIVRWKKERVTFLNRLHDDLSAIANTFSLDSTVIHSIKSNTSDAHNNGQVVRIITFLNNKNVVYKPKNLDVDMAYYDFFKWIDESGFTNPPYAPNVIPKGDYGWVEYIPHIPVSSTDEFKEYYYNSGCLLSCLHLLKATDCHHENIVASSSTLTLIDCETVMHPQVKLADDFSSSKDINQLFMQSIFRTGFIPNWNPVANTEYISDISGLGGLRYFPNAIGRVFDINLNQPTLDNSFNYYKYRSDIEAGFGDIYRFFYDNKLNIVKKSPLLSFKAKKTRYIYRATEIYAKILKYALTPIHLKSGILFSTCIDVLSRSHLKETALTPYWDIFKHESECLHKLDIPYFYTYTNSKKLYIDDKSQLNFFEEAGYEFCIKGIKKLDNETLSYELNILRGALLASNIVPKHAATDKSSILNKVTNHSTGNEKDVFVEAAKSIAMDIINRRLEKNSFNWLSFSLNTKTDRYQFGPIGFNLYDGVAGIAVFYSALYSITNDDEFFSYAIKTIEPIRQIIKEKNDYEISSFIQQMGLGAASGIGSVIYSLALMAEYLEDYTILDDANYLASSLTPEIINSDQLHDIISGNAGLILGLIKLYEVLPNESTYILLQTSGDALVRSILDSNFPLEIASSTTTLTGFSHGAAGIAYSLYKLYDITGNTSYMLNGQKAIEYEQYQLDRCNLKYSDNRLFSQTERTNTPNAWCHGISGILQSRVGILKHLNKRTFEINKSIDVLTSTENYGEDHVCCGNMGRIDALLSAGIELNDKSLINLAEKRARKIIESHRKNGHYQLNSLIPNSYSSVGFFQGLSGIGYQMLRTHSPKKIKSVLMFC